MFFGKIANAQIFTPPYQNYFTIAGDTVGWSHYALSGIDEWENGYPSNPPFHNPCTQPNAWAVDLDDEPEPSSEIVLETPYFNLLDTTVEYMLTFHHKKGSTSSERFYLEYSNDHGSSWSILEDTNSTSFNWQSSTGFPLSMSAPYANYSYFISAINLRFLQGQDSLKFRFRYISGGGPTTNKGWNIDDFQIIEEYYNIYATSADTLRASKAGTCSSLDVISFVGFHNPYGQYFSNVTNFYLSQDTIIDSGDIFLGSDTFLVRENRYNYTFPISIPVGINAGIYYVMYKHDFTDSLIESSEIDNINYAVLYIDSLYSLPYVEDFENGPTDWLTYNQSGLATNWELGEGYTHHLENAHSGTHAWHTGSFLTNPITQDQYLESGFIDITSDTSQLVINFWMKQYSGQVPPTCKVERSSDCGNGFIGFWPVNPLFSTTHESWDFVNKLIDTTNFFPITSGFKFRIYWDPGSGEGISIDDIYIGSIKSDLTIEMDKEDRFTSTLINSDTLKYQLVNSGLKNASSSITSFYWSNDSIFDISDIYIGANVEPVLSDTSRNWMKFYYNKPTTTPGKYYIFYKLDTANTVDEMRETNNDGYFVIYQEPTISFPYTNDFETQITGWRHNASLGNDDWVWGTPAGALISNAFSGSKAWITNDTGSVSHMSRMHLYSPIFDLSNSVRPVMEFNMINYAGGGSYSSGRAGANIEYSIDGGATWALFDTSSTSFKALYYFMEFHAYSGKDVDDSGHRSSNIMHKNYEKNLVITDDYQSRNTTNTIRQIIDISHLKNYDAIQFRFNVSNSTDTVEGLMFDDFSLMDSTIDLSVDYKNILMFSSLSSEVKFIMDISNNGNYISNSCTNRYYLSVDSLLDVSDSLIGTEIIPEIRPDKRYQINEIFPAPQGLSNFNYLIYELDVLNENSEINEVNNIGAWELALDSISTYPYLMDFNTKPVLGWNSYALNAVGVHLKDSWRFRNKLAPEEPVFQTEIKENEMYTEMINSLVWDSKVPIHHLESPSFDFTNMDTIQMSFDLWCYGRKGSNSDGGNMDFSTDGGNTWTLLNMQGASTNWYNEFPVVNLYNEDGWANHFQHAFDSTKYDISFLSGQPNVVFRFKYRSKYVPGGLGTKQGMRIDNFLIDGTLLPVGLDEIKSNITASIYPNPLNENSILFIGKKNSTICQINIYNSIGQKIKHITTSDNQVKLGNSFFEPGLYLIEISSSDYATEVLKFLVK